MSIFSKVAMPRPQHNTFDLSHDKKMSAKIGEITPIALLECVPGDKFDIKVSTMLRFAPLIAPVMHQSSVYCHFFFVPNRIVWENWPEFITGGEDAAEPGYTPPAFPVFRPSGAPAELLPGCLADYLGLPTKDDNFDGKYDGHEFNAIPFAVYNKIYNDYYRDENLIDKLDDTLGNGANTFSNFNTIQQRAWQHDYFTSALPWTQKGPEATIPLGTKAPIDFVPFDASISPPNYTLTRQTDGSLLPNIAGLDSTSTGVLNTTTGNQNVWLDNSRNLETDLTQATAASINDLRRAFRLQEWLERNARGGSRYIEVILAHFGVQSSDARLQRPEFLGGSATPVTISEVLQTSETGLAQDAGQTPTPQANMAGHGVSVGSSNYVSYRCEEHGFIMGLITIMPKSAYQQGIPKIFNKFDKFDYYWPSFANIGEQPIYNRELYFDNDQTAGAEVFGYTPRYAEYKYIPSTVHGQFRTTLDFWHMGRIFENLPSLNQDFVECNEKEVDRVFAVEESEENLYVYLHNHIKARRPMPYFGTPTI